MRSEIRLQLYSGQTCPRFKTHTPSRPRARVGQPLNRRARPVDACIELRHTPQTSTTQRQTMGTERVDIAIVGAGLAGLSTAVACHKVRPDARIKVYDRRKAPAGYASPPEDTTQNTTAATAEPAAVGDDQAGAVGGGVRLEMNGLKACAAISRDLAGRVVNVCEQGAAARHTRCALSEPAASPNAPGPQHCTRPALNAVSATECIRDCALPAHKLCLKLPGTCCAAVRVCRLCRRRCCDEPPA